MPSQEKLTPSPSLTLSDNQIQQVSDSLDLGQTTTACLLDITFNRPVRPETLANRWDMNSPSDAYHFVDSELEPFIDFDSDMRIKPTDTALNRIQSILDEIEPESSSESMNIEALREKRPDQFSSKIAGAARLSGPASQRLIDLVQLGETSLEVLASYWGVGSSTDVRSFIQSNLSKYATVKESTVAPTEDAMELVGKFLSDAETLPVRDDSIDSQIHGSPSNSESESERTKQKDKEYSRPTPSTVVAGEAKLQSLPPLHKGILYVMPLQQSAYTKELVEELQSRDESVTQQEVERSLDELVKNDWLVKHTNFALSSSYSLTETASKLVADARDDEPPTASPKQEQLPNNVSRTHSDETTNKAEKSIPEYWRTASLEKELLLEELQSIATDFGRPPSESELFDELPDAIPPGAYLYRFGSLPNAFDAAGLEATNQPSGNSERKYTSLSVLFAVQIVADVLHETPRTPEFETLAPMSSGVSSRFKGWNRCLNLAGLDPDEKRQSSSNQTDYDDDDIREAIETVADDLGRAPTLAEITENSTVSGSYVLKAFGSWRDAMEVADVDPTSVRDMESEELLSGYSAATRTLIQRLENELDGNLTYEKFLTLLPDTDLNPFTHSQFKDDPVYTGSLDTETSSNNTSANTISSKTDNEDTTEDSSSNESSKASNDSENQITSEEGVPPTEQDLEDELHRLRSDFDHPPRPIDVEKYGRYDRTEYGGPWNRVLDQIGADITEAWVEVDDHDEELLEAFADLEDQLGHRPTWRNIDEIGEFSAASYQQRFEDLETVADRAENGEH